MKILDAKLLKDIFEPGSTSWALVLDADRTLASPDTGRMVGSAFGVNEAIRKVFQEGGYSSGAFLKVAEIWAGVPADDYFSEVSKVAQEIVLHDVWCRLIETLSVQSRIVVVTSGIPQVWQQVLGRYGFADIDVIGGCRRGTDDYVVCPQGKLAVVEAFQIHGAKVVAAGDSEIDLPMLHAADVGVVVPDYKGSKRLFASLPAHHYLRYLKMDDEIYPIPSITEEELRITVRGN